MVRLLRFSSVQFFKFWVNGAKKSEKSRGIAFDDLFL
mgnify:CR=1 FL=1